LRKVGIKGRVSNWENNNDCSGLKGQMYVVATLTSIRKGRDQYRSNPVKYVRGRSDIISQVKRGRCIAIRGSRKVAFEARVFIEEKKEARERRFRQGDQT